MEAFLHLVWQSRQYSELIPVGTIVGQIVEVVDPGIHNLDAGADFFNAKVKIGDLLWSGNVEIHTHASEWAKHMHHRDPAYESVILHVVTADDASAIDSKGREVPTCVMKVPDELRQRAEQLMSECNAIACAASMSRLPEGFVSSWLGSLLDERLDTKVYRIRHQWYETSRDWNECLYRAVLYYFAHGLNGETMGLLTQRLPLKYLLWHRDNPLQLEALLLGVADLLMLEEDDLRRSLLIREYQFLSHKYALKALERRQWKRSKVRPAALPESRLRQVAALLCSGFFSVQAILDATTLAELRALFSINDTSEVCTRLSEQIVDGLIINVAIPLRLLAVEELNQEGLKADTLSMLSQLPLERNKITKLFGSLGLPMRHAGDGQAVLHLYKHYCQMRRCMYCRAGRHHLGIQMGQVRFAPSPNG